MRRVHATGRSLTSHLTAAALLLIASFTPLSSAAAEGKILAVYGDAVAQTNPPPGWSFQWNAGGVMGDSTGYVPLACVELKGGRRTTHKYGLPDEAGGVRPDRPNFSAAGDAFGYTDDADTDRYAIASYTLQDESAGNVWIQHGNLLTRSFDGSVLEIYLNNDLNFRATGTKGVLPLLFQKELGHLKKGDTVRVAVGPAARTGKGGGRMRFVLEDLPVGTQPGPPVNILSPPITAAAPPRKADGSYDTYAERHQAQCAALVSNRSELVFIGDSITARWPAELLQEKFGKYRPANLGIGGDWVQNVLWRVLNGALDKVRIKVIVLLIGTNNLSNGFTPEEVAAGIERILQLLHEKSPESKILLLGILPKGASVTDRANDAVRQVNAKLAQMADGQRVVYLDVGPALVEPDGTIRDEVMPDHLHVAMPGFLRWMDAMQPTLDKMLE